MGNSPKNAADIAKGVVPKLSAVKKPAAAKPGAKKAPAKKDPAKKPQRRPGPKAFETTEIEEGIELATAPALNYDNPKHARLLRFIDEYMIDLNATQAATRAGYSAKTAQQQSSRLLSNIMVQGEISKRQKERRERLGTDSDVVYKYVHALATIDTNELVENRIDACRCCWGKGNRYQYTAHEMEERTIEYNKECRQAARDGEDMPEWDERGGIGFNPKVGPNPDCQQCFGDGVQKMVMKDTRHLSPQARMAYGGMKTTKDGVEMKVYERTKAMDMLARHEGFYKDSLDVNHGVQMTDEELDGLYAKAQANANAGKDALEERSGILGDLDD
jgi:phage terminase small subunit